MDKTALRSFVARLYQSCSNIKVGTRSIGGTKNFTTWEWNISFNFVAALEEMAGDKELGAADGREVKMVGVSVSWWNGEGKIVKNNDYTKVVETFD